MVWILARSHILLYCSIVDVPTRKRTAIWRNVYYKSHILCIISWVLVYDQLHYYNIMQYII